MAPKRILILSNPRSGSTLVANYLKSHPNIHIAHELLNDEEEIPLTEFPNPLDYVEHLLQDLAEENPSASVIGFKLFPEQIYSRGLTFEQVILHLGITHVIVLWRSNLLETYVSRLIASQTGNWYSIDEPTEIHSVAVDPKVFEKYKTTLLQQWKLVGQQWPVHVVPTYIEYETFINNRVSECNRILEQLSCTMIGSQLQAYCKRQNPASLNEKISNWSEIQSLVNSNLLINERLNVQSILEPLLESNLKISPELLEFVPDREPSPPVHGWRYRVAEPYIPKSLKLNVYEAIESGYVSSAGSWVNKFSVALQNLFHVPVAQPCSNGFTAIALALQTIGLNPDDEVILPSLTMIAVANAVTYSGGKPVFADSMTNNYNSGWDEIQAVSTEKTKVVIVTHTYGVPTPNLQEIVTKCKERGWWLIEDISECVGIEILIENNQQEEESRLLGQFGDFACASLYANKIVHGGDGGFVLAKNPLHAERLKSLANHAFTPSYHFVHFEAAMNCKINGVGAAMALGCLQELDFIMKHRSQLATQYRQELNSYIKMMPQCGWKDTPWVFGVECGSKAERTKLRKFLAKYGIESRDYFFPLHLQPAYNKNGNQNLKRLPNSEKYGSTCFYLPTFTNLNPDDISYICMVIKKYYDELDLNSEVLNGVDDDTDPSSALCIEPPPRPKIQSIFIEPDTFNLSVKSFNSSIGQFQADESWGFLNKHGHPYKKGVKLMLELEEGLVLESWSKQQLLLEDLQDQINVTSNNQIMQEKLINEFQMYIDYFKSQSCYTELSFKSKPWLSENLNDESIYKHAFNIPTTTDPETIQCLIWLVKQNHSKVIWELGTWFGHTTVRLAAATTTTNVNENSKSQVKIFACDVFQRQKWMQKYLEKKNDKNASGKSGSFLSLFQDNVSVFKEFITPIVWPYTITKLPEILQEETSRPDLIFIDMTQEEADLEHIWNLTSPQFIPNHTILVFNGFVAKSLPFFTRHATCLKPIAKPSTIAKAFLYVESEKCLDTNEESCSSTTGATLERKLKFHSSPSWTHHHRNAFGVSVELLKSQLHSPDASTLFIPAVEETICDEPQLLATQSWVGIIHSVISHPEYFYTPDLSRICSAEFVPALRNCKGLFTLTKLQSDYLQVNLKAVLGYIIPIHNLTYPMILEQDSEFKLQNPSSNVVEAWKNGERITLLLVGSFARDFDLFYSCQVPENLIKTILVGDEMIQTEVDQIQVETKKQNIQILPRLGEIEYEETLRNSIIFLPLKYDGAANTTILECIGRNIPILIPSLSSCLEYIGQDYPLTYTFGESTDFTKLLTLERIQDSIKYLNALDKSRFDPSKLIENVKSSAVLLAVPPETETGREFSYDVTISICSYKRTHHLPNILASLWNQQDYSGSYQIIIWNNNCERSEILYGIVKKYLQESKLVGNLGKKSLEMIDSTTNYYCSVRLALAPLMKSSNLLICDDDIIPSTNFISYFMSAHTRYPSNVLCTRGHVFLPHKLNLEAPTNVWNEYKALRFKSDEAPEQFIHFVHADTCLIPKSALLEICSEPMPDSQFNLVDDYWMSFVLNSKYGRQLRKLTTAGLSETELPFTRTDDSDLPGLALHTRPEVKDAKIRLYIHHMLQNWPMFNVQEDEDLVMDEDFILSKKSFWTKQSPFIGYNVSSCLSIQDVEKLVQLGVTCVRIGAVGTGGGNILNVYPHEFDRLDDNPEATVKQLVETIQLLQEYGIYVVVTCVNSKASILNWTHLAKGLRKFNNVIGYDLINEPFLKSELVLHRSELENIQPNGIPSEMKFYIELIKAVRSIDSATPIILEPTFWGHLDALRVLPIQAFLQHDSNLVVSFHFYEPRLITQRSKNKGRFSFPGIVPIFDNIKYSETISWDANQIKTQLTRATDWAKQHNVPICLGEFGICRDAGGSCKYLEAIMTTCVEIGMSGFIYSFRDKGWDAMNYEYGMNPNNFHILIDKDESDNNNNLMKVIKIGIEMAKMRHSTEKAQECEFI